VKSLTYTPIRNWEELVAYCKAQRAEKKKAKARKRARKAKRLPR